MSSEDFDAMLAEMGDCGLYQFGQYMLIGLAFLYSAASPIVYVFTAALVPHRCLVPECGDENESSPFNPPWLGSALPVDPESGEPEQCLRFAPLNASTCSFDQSQRIRCDQWVNKGPENTIQTAFDLTCSDNEWKMALVGSINSLGVLFSVPIVGYIADRYGRKLSLVVTLVASAILALVKTAAPSYNFFAVFEFLEALFSGGIYGIAFVMALEYVSPKRRVVLGDMVAAWSYSLGNITVGLLAWGLRDWRHILWAINAPALLFVCYIWLVPESIRWLLSRGRLRDAKKVFSRALANNKTNLSAANADKLQLWENIKRSDAGIDLEGVVGEESLWPSLKLVATSKILVFRLLICFFCWVVVTLVYYGLSLNSVNLAGTDDQYLNFILVSLADMPSNLLTWLGMTKLGRQKTLCLTLIFSGAACFANPFVPEDAMAARLPLYLIGKVAISGAFGVVYMFTAEIFPTKLRTSLLGLCSMVGRLGSMLAPLTPLLTNYSKFLPLALFGVLALVAGGLAFLLPETKGRPLPVTVEEAENLGRKQPE